MQDYLKAAVAEIAFPGGVQVNLAHLVREMERATVRCRRTSDAVVWECEDLAFIDVNGTRILLAVIEPDDRFELQRLFLSVGPAPDATRSTPLSRRHTALARLLVERLRQRISGIAITWYHLRGVIDAEVIEDLADGRTASPCLPRDLMQRNAGVIHATRMATSDEQDISARMSRARSAIYADEGESKAEPSLAIRLATHLMNGALAVAAFPVGGALVVHSALRGKVDTRLTARAMGLVGALSVAGQTGLLEAGLSRLI